MVMDAEALLDEANKKLRSAGHFFQSIFGGSSSKMDEAADLLTQAGNKFKLDKQWRRAGEAYQKAAEVHMQVNGKHDAAQSYVEASSAYRKVDPQLGADILAKAVEILTGMGRFSMAARYCQTIAEIYEQEVLDPKKAIEFYEKSAEFYQGEDATTSANKCLLKVAELAALEGEYRRAIDIFETVAGKSVQNNLLKYSVKDYLFRACLCQLCVDNLNAQMALDRYSIDILPGFPDSREYKLVKKLSEAVEASNLEMFNEAVAEYDKIGRPDNWASQLLLRIKKPLEGAETADEGLL